MNIPQQPLSSDEMRVLKKEILKHFECQKSGNCCRCPGVVYANAHEISYMAKLLNKAEIEFRLDYVVRRNGWDVIADQSHRPGCFVTPENTCAVYEARPQACKTYPDWPSIWESQETLLNECKLCPGLKKAVAIFSDLKEN